LAAWIKINRFSISCGWPENSRITVGLMLFSNSLSGVPDAEEVACRFGFAISKYKE
jgi:hypothetical protein